MVFSVVLELNRVYRFLCGWVLFFMEDFRFLWLFFVGFFFIVFCAVTVIFLYERVWSFFVFGLGWGFVGVAE